MGTEAAVSLLIVAGVVGTLGVLIRYFGMASLIAGYDPDKVTDQEGLADYIGMNVLYVAGLTLLVAAMEYTQPFDGIRGIWIVYILAVGLLTIRMVRGGRRYETS